MIRTRRFDRSSSLCKHSHIRSAAERVILESLERRQLLSVTVLNLNDPAYRDVRSETQPIAYNEFDDHEGLSVGYIHNTVTLQNRSGFLSGPRSGDAELIAREFLLANAANLGLSPGDISSAATSYKYTDDTGAGLTHVYLRQTFAGREVMNADMGVHVAADGRVLSVSGSFMRGLGTLQTVEPTVPAVTALDALQVASDQFGLTMGKAVRTGGTVDAPVYTLNSLSREPITLESEHVLTAKGAVLAWHFNVQPPNSSDWYDLAVDGSGRIIYATNWVDHASYNVYPVPQESPSDGGRSIVTDPHNVTASPFGWHDTNGVAGAEFTITQGNNVSAYEDIDNNNSPPATRTNGGASLNFDFPIDLAQAPNTYIDGATTNLFYWNNVIHDLHYKYGFTSQARNFQTSTYGMGGIGNDHVLAEAQDGGGTNNANFGTPPDGSSGRMQMYTWTAPTPDRDGDLDAGIIIHEYGHGVSNRLTNNASGLNAIQSGGMGEGWGDWWALMFTQKPSDVQVQGYPIGTYALGQAPNGAGIRRRPYSFDMSIDPLTFDAYGTSGTTSYGVTRTTAVHASGELWCSSLWDINWLLINKYGYDANLFTGYNGSGTPAEQAGNKLALQLVMDGLKLQPSNPSFVQARDAILAADTALSGGANHPEIWQAFARRGLGYSASTSSSGATSVNIAFDIPPVKPKVMTYSPSASAVPFSSTTFNFSEAMNPASFSIASDVQSFTGPGAVDLLPQITGFSWNGDSTSLTVNYATQSATGTYTMTIGPNILALDDGSPMDQNQNNTAGEPADSFTATTTFSTITAPNAFGYRAGTWVFDTVDLEPGQPGVSAVLTSVDDAGFNLATLLGSNTFRYFNTTYNSGTANAITFSDNGSLAFGVLTSSSANNDMSGASGQSTAARFSPLWSDWVTNTGTDDQVLYKFDDQDGNGTSDRLIIEWNKVPHFQGTTNPVTFQAILQLNTGTSPGYLIANYLDTDTGAGDAHTNGASSTLGIRNSTPTNGDNLVLGFNNSANPWVGSNRAVRFSTDWTSPLVSSTGFRYLTGPQAVQVQFGENVGPSVQVGDMVVQNLTDSTTVPTASMAKSYDGGSNTATFTFPGYAGGILPDGNYRATINKNAIYDAGGMVLAADVVVDFFAFGGDADRNRTVNSADFNVLATNFGATSGMDFADADFTYDGAVNSADFNILATNFGETLAPPSSAGGTSGRSTTGSLPGGASGSTGIFGGTKIGDGTDDDGDDDGGVPPID